MKASIIMTTADVRSSIAEACLRSLKDNTDPGEYELIILDNNHNRGFNHAHEVNRGINIANGEYIVLIDDDVIFTNSRWLDAMIKCAESPDVGVVGAKLMNPEQGIDHTGGFIRKWDGYSRVRVGHLQDDIKTPREVDYVCSACLLINMTRFDMLRWFNPDYRMYFEDADFCCRIWSKGWKVMCTPHAEVIHQYNATKSGRDDATRILDQDRETFVRTWIDTGKLKTIERFTDEM